MNGASIILVPNSPSFFVKTGHKDEVPYANIVKKIHLIQIKPDTYLLEEDEDKQLF